jgi:hypothetical protein
LSPSIVIYNDVQRRGTWICSRVGIVAAISVEGLHMAFAEL